MCSPCALVTPDRLVLPSNRPRPPLADAFLLQSIPRANRSLNAPYFKSLPRLPLFAPAHAKPDGWAAEIFASQHPMACRRFLLLEDDMVGSGLGMDARLMGNALLIAMAHRRVMLRVPGRAQPYKFFKGGGGRWCDRPPYTLDCLWEPLSHCDPPPASASESTPKVRYPWGMWDDRFDVVRVPLSWLKRSIGLWHGIHTHANAAALKFLFRPRPWVVRIADCVMAEAGLHPRRFVSVFLRHSPEKEAELRKYAEAQTMGRKNKKRNETIPIVPASAYRLPSAGAMLALAGHTGRALGLDRLFVQSTSQTALNDFLADAPQFGLSASCTRVARDSDPHYSLAILRARLLATNYLTHVARTRSRNTHALVCSSCTAPARDGTPCVAHTHYTSEVSVPRGYRTCEERTGRIPQRAAFRRNNSRVEHDSWGGRTAQAAEAGSAGSAEAAAMRHGLVAAVNLCVASHAAAFIGISDSMWTYLSGSLVQRSDRVGSPKAHKAVQFFTCSGSQLRISLVPYDPESTLDRQLVGVTHAERQMPLRGAGGRGGGGEAMVCRWMKPSVTRAMHERCFSLVSTYFGATSSGYELCP